MPTENAAPDLQLAQRVKFDRWLFDRDIDNVAAAKFFDSHPVSIGRWRKRFDDPDRRVPPSGKIMEIAEKTGGEVGLPDWYRPCGVLYVEGEPVSDAPEAGQ